MRPNPQFPADLVAFTEEIFNGKLHFLCSVILNYTQTQLNLKFLENLHLILQLNKLTLYVK